MTTHHLLVLALFFTISTSSSGETVDISNDILGTLNLGSLTNAPVTGATGPLAATTTVSGATAPAGPTPNDILAVCMRTYPADICGKAYFNTYMKNVPPSMVATTASGHDPMMECVKAFGPTPVCEMAFAGKSAAEEPKQDNFMVMMMLMQMMNGGENDSGGPSGGFSVDSIGIGDPSSSLMGGVGY